MNYRDKITDDRLRTFLAEAPPFIQPWWLEAVSPGHWDYVCVMHGEELAAVMPYVWQQQAGCRSISMPALTQHLGPWFQPSLGKYQQQLARQKELMTELIELLPACHYFRQNFHWSHTNWLPFYWHGFKQTTRYTYQLTHLQDLDQLWRNFSRSLRANITKAQSALTVETTDDVALLYGFCRLTFQRKSMCIPYALSYLQRIDQACRQHQAAQIFIARDASQAIHAALYLLWTPQCAYYLVGGIAPQYASSGAMSLLFWQALQYVSDKTKIFDFEGSMIESIEKFFRSFNARQVPYFSIIRDDRKFIHKVIQKFSHKIQNNFRSFEGPSTPHKCLFL